MTPLCWAGFAVAFVVGGAVVMCVFRRGHRAAPLKAVVTHTAVTLTDTDRHNWLVRLDTRLENPSKHPHRVIKVACQAPAQDGRTLVLHRICGDYHQAAVLRSHPPDLAMRLPLEVRQAVDFTFEMIFEHRLAQLWPALMLRVTFTTEAGGESLVSIPLPPAPAAG